MPRCAVAPERQCPFLCARTIGVALAIVVVSTPSAQPQPTSSTCGTAETCSWTNTCACGTCNTVGFNHCVVSCGQCGTPDPRQYTFVGYGNCRDASISFPQQKRFVKSRGFEESESNVNGRAYCRAGCDEDAACAAYSFGAKNRGGCTIYGAGLDRHAMNAQGWGTVYNPAYQVGGTDDFSATYSTDHDIICYRKTSAVSTPPSSKCDGSALVVECSNMGLTNVPALPNPKTTKV